MRHYVRRKAGVVGTSGGNPSVTPGVAGMMKIFPAAEKTVNPKRRTMLTQRTTEEALKYEIGEWPAMKRVLEYGDVELLNNLSEQMMRIIKMNLNSACNIIGSEISPGTMPSCTR